MFATSLANAPKGCNVCPMLIFHDEININGKHLERTMMKYLHSQKSSIVHAYGQ
jgi:hypothetical protein